MDNMRDMKAKKRGAVGERHGMARLTEGEVLEIRSRLEQGATQTALSVEFGISTATVGMISRRQIWAHVPEAVAS
jgi:hypothetical protein